MTADWLLGWLQHGTGRFLFVELDLLPHYVYGLDPTMTSSTKFTIAPGVENMGGGPVSLPSTVTATISGTGSGRGFVYFDMAHSNAFTVSVPANVSVSCSGVPAPVPLREPNDGTCNYSDGWPRDSSNNPAAGPIACVDISGGAISRCTQCGCHHFAMEYRRQQLHDRWPGTRSLHRHQQLDRRCGLGLAPRRQRWNGLDPR